MLTDDEIKKRINEIYKFHNSRKGKYLRNYRRYCNTPKVGLENIKDPSIIGYWEYDMSPEVDTTPTPSLNVCKSAVDTLTSKMAQSKVRPFFNCINGSFKDIQICKQSQQFFDQYFDFQNVQDKVAMAFRDACIFDTGWIYIDEESKNIYKALPWQVYFRPAEFTYDKMTRIYYERIDYPTCLLPDDIKKDIYKKFDDLQYVTYGVYYDIDAGIKAKYVQNINKVYKEEFDSDRLPFIPLHYMEPISGQTSVSVVDMLNSIQLEIDTLMAKVKDASQLNPCNTFFVPDGSNIKVGQLSNRVGNIVTYKPVPDVSNPVTTSTPPFIDSQYIQLIDELIQKAYEMIGISALSAQSKKPTGLDSGIALSTMEDVESDRFETQLNQIIKTYVDIAKTCIACFKKSDNILPDSAARVNIKWSDIVGETKKMTIQYSGADALSKDPSEKLKQLQTLAQAGIIPSSRIAQFMQIPDIDSGYSLSNNAINAVLSVIDDCIKNDNYDLPTYIPFDMLKEEIINTQLSLRAANYEKNKKDIDKLTKLYQKTVDEAKKWITASNADTANEASKKDDATIPQQTNVLTKEAAMDNNTPDLDMSTDNTGSAGWNRGTNYNQAGAENNPMTAEDNNSM